MPEEYDFYSMGARCAQEGLVHLRSQAEKIEAEFGMDARMEFESGIIATVPVYADFLAQEVSLEENLRGSAHFGVDNTRNNSYFGTYGTGVQYVVKEGRQVYNEPKIKK